MNAKQMFDTKPDRDPPLASNRAAQSWTCCEFCHRWFAAKTRALESGRHRVCSTDCWDAGVVPLGLQRGANNNNWRGGVSNDNMRYRRRQKARHPEKELARRLVHDAVREGRLTRQPCEVCGSIPTHGHHDDYSKPLDVRWLCRACHDAHHRRAG